MGGERGARVLLVEDDPAISALIAIVLEDEGYAVTLATDLGAALDALSGPTFDLIITDALADRHGADARWSAVEAIRRAARDTPTVICTASHPRAFADYAARGFRALIQKPFDLDPFLAVVGAILDTGEGRGATAGEGPDEDEKG